MSNIIDTYTHIHIYLPAKKDRAYSGARDR